jgi:hypothetical protein
MRELLDGLMAPVTQEIGFLETDAARAAERFAAWHSSLSRLRIVRFKQRRVEGDFKTLLCALHPLTSILRRRFLFVPTESRWTAYFDNGHNGTDAFPVMSVLAEELECRGIRAVAIPERADEDGVVIFELYGPRKQEWLNVERAIGSAAKMGAGTSGSPARRFPSRRRASTRHPEFATVSPSSCCGGMCESSAESEFTTTTFTRPAMKHGWSRGRACSAAANSFPSTAAPRRR